MFTERTFPAKGLDLSGAVGPGHGPPLWLFHGLARRWQDFTPLLVELSARWTVTALDHRGHGRSARGGGRYLVADYVADAVAALRAAAEPAVLVGHSLGALVALGAAGRVPTLVRAVVLLDPPGAQFLGRVRSTPYHAMWIGMRRLAGGRPVPDVARELAALSLPGPRPGQVVRLGDVRDAASLRWMAHCLHDLDPDALGPPVEGRWLDGFDPLTAAAQVRCPALLVVADTDRGGVLPPGDADPLAAALHDCARVDLTGVGHLIHWQDAAAALRLLHGFLGSL